MLIRSLMTSPAVTVSGDTPVGDALRLLDEHRITALPVIDRDGRLLGVVSEADLLRDAVPVDAPAGIAPLRLSTVTPARRIDELMTNLVISVDADADVDEAIDLMTSTMVKSLPVVLHGRVIGVISRSDVVHLLATRDRRIRDEVLVLLRGECDDCGVDVRDGVVTVTGATSDHERRLAELLAGAVAGVVAVHVR
ncbi:MAG TPA: CBS domain-containing protein [Kribbellaceae bacterium]